MAFLVGLLSVWFIVLIPVIWYVLDDSAFVSIGGVNLAISFFMSSILISYYIGEMISPDPVEGETIEERKRYGWLVLGSLFSFVLILVLFVLFNKGDWIKVGVLGIGAIIGVLLMALANLSGVIKKKMESEELVKNVGKFLSGVGIYQFIHVSFIRPLLAKIFSEKLTIINMVFAIIAFGLILLLVHLFVFDLSKFKNIIEIREIQVEKESLQDEEGKDSDGNV